LGGGGEGGERWRVGGGEGEDDHVATVAADGYVLLVLMTVSANLRIPPPMHVSARGWKIA